MNLGDFVRLDTNKHFAIVLKNVLKGVGLSANSYQSHNVLYFFKDLF